VDDSIRLKKNAHPTDAEIDRIENVCRCGTYSRIRNAIKSVAAEALRLELNVRPGPGTARAVPCLCDEKCSLATVLLSTDHGGGIVGC
jgi:hypothetical protein